MNSVTPIRPVDRPYRQIGDPAKCAWCGERAKSAFAIVSSTWLRCGSLWLGDPERNGSIRRGETSPNGTVRPTLSHASTIPASAIQRAQRRPDAPSVPPDARLKRPTRVREAHVEGASRHHRSGELWCRRPGVELPRLMAWMTRTIASVQGPLSSSTAINLARSVSICDASKATR